LLAIDDHAVFVTFALCALEQVEENPLPQFLQDLVRDMVLPPPTSDVDGDVDSSTGGVGIGGSSISGASASLGSGNDGAAEANGAPSSNPVSSTVTAAARRGAGEGGWSELPPYEAVTHCTENEEDFMVQARRFGGQPLFVGMSAIDSVRELKRKIHRLQLDVAPEFQLIRNSDGYFLPDGIGMVEAGLETESVVSLFVRQEGTGEVVGPGPHTDSVTDDTDDLFDESNRVVLSAEEAERFTLPEPHRLTGRLTGHPTPLSRASRSILAEGSAEEAASATDVRGTTSIATDGGGDGLAVGVTARSAVLSPLPSPQLDLPLLASSRSHSSSSPLPPPPPTPPLSVTSPALGTSPTHLFSSASTRRETRNLDALASPLLPSPLLPSPLLPSPLRTPDAHEKVAISSEEPEVGGGGFEGSEDDAEDDELLPSYSFLQRTEMETGLHG
jgi:hypothetical protein